jgi:hypothetical protein
MEKDYLNVGEVIALLSKFPSETPVFSMDEYNRHLPVREVKASSPAENLSDSTGDPDSYVLLSL